MSVVDSMLQAVRRVPFAGGLVNRVATNRVCGKTTPRPRAFSLWSHVEKPRELDQQGPVGEYTTWPMLTDRLYSSRHLPPAEQSYVDGLPEDAPYNDNPAKGLSLCIR